MASWPVTLPNLQPIGLTDSTPGLLIRTSMSAPVPKVRRRFPASVRPVQMPMTMDGGQRHALEGFIENDLDGGALSFTWEDPTTDETVTFRFVSLPTNWRLISGSEWTAERLWTVVLNLEIIPT